MAVGVNNWYFPAAETPVKPRHAPRARMTAALYELLCQADSFVNSPAYRNKSGDAGRTREIRTLTLSYPTGMIQAERDRLARSPIDEMPVTDPHLENGPRRCLRDTPCAQGAQRQPSNMVPPTRAHNLRYPIDLTAQRKTTRFVFPPLERAHVFRLTGTGGVSPPSTAGPSACAPRLAVWVRLAGLESPAHQSEAG